MFFVVVFSQLAVQDGQSKMNQEVHLVLVRGQEKDWSKEMMCPFVRVYNTSNDRESIV